MIDQGKLLKRVMIVPLAFCFLLVGLAGQARLALWMDSVICLRKALGKSQFSTNGVHDVPERERANSTCHVSGSGMPLWT
jgi:hypothetical protein